MSKTEINQLDSTNLTRRNLNKVLAGMGLSVLVMPVTSKMTLAAPNDQPLFFGWAGYEERGLHEAYLEKHGEMPRFGVWGSEEEGVAKIMAGYTPDVLFPCNYKIKSWHDTGALEPIDTSKLSNFSSIFPDLLNIKGSVVDGKRYWVPIDWGQTSIIYRTDLAPEYVGNESWEILWDPKFKGRTAMFDSIVDGMSIAAIVAGADPWDYESDESFNKTKAKMRELVPNLLYFSNDTTTLSQGLASGELIASTGWNEMLVDLEKQGVPVKWMNPREGGPLTFVCGLSIVKGTKHLDKAHDLIDSMLDVRSRIWEVENFGYGSSTTAPYEKDGSDGVQRIGQILGASNYQQPIKGESRAQAMLDEIKAGL